MQSLGLVERGDGFEEIVHELVGVGLCLRWKTFVVQEGPHQYESLDLVHFELFADGEHEFPVGLLDAQDDAIWQSDRARLDLLL